MVQIKEKMEHEDNVWSRRQRTFSFMPYSATWLYAILVTLSRSSLAPVVMTLNTSSFECVR